MLNCHDTTRLISASRDRPLTWRERIALRLHVMMCAGCRRFGKQMQFLRAAAQEYAKGSRPHSK